MKLKYPLRAPDFTAININIEKVSRPRGFRHSYRGGRPKHGFIYTVRGKMCNQFGVGDKGQIYVNEGELVFIPKGSVYTGIYLEDNTEIQIIHFDIANGDLPEYLLEPVKIELPRVKELLDDFFKPLQRNNHPFYFLSCLYRFLWQIDEIYSGLPQKFQRLQAAINEINEHFDENEQVSHYAELCGISEVSFRRLFREYTGMSPIEYRNDVRLNYAKSKLQSGEYNVSEAALLSGFTNLSFFTRLYKKKFGHTPKQE